MSLTFRAISFALAVAAVSSAEPIRIGLTSDTVNPEPTSHWPQMRGPTNDGHAVATDLPVTWSETENVAWKTAIPGQGWSSPVVDSENVWLTTATDSGRSRRLLCVNRNSGKIARDIELFAVPEPEPKHDFNSHASPTPVMESGRLYATFGSVGTACVDAGTGAVLWRNTSLECDHYRGAGSSPLLYGDLLLMHFDGIDVQYVVGLAKKTGNVVWRTDRSYITTVEKDGDLKKAYTTPFVAEVDGRDQMISVGAECVHGYEPLTGKEVWRCRFGGYSNAAWPLHANGLFYINTGFGRATLLAIKQGGEGDVTDTNIAWVRRRDVGRMSSPIIVNNHLYVVSDNGLLTCLDAETGAETWKQSLGKGLNFTSSPVFAAGQLYVFDHKAGKGIVVRPGDAPEILATNTLASGCMASPAVAGNGLYVRTKTHLYRLESAK